MFYAYVNHDKGYSSGSRGYGYSELETELKDNGVVILQVIPNDDGSVDFITPEAEDSVLDEVFDIFMANVRRQFELEMGEEVAHTEDNAGDSEK